VSDRVELETLFHERPAPGVAVVTLNRPDRGNGVVVELVRDLFGLLDGWESDPSVRVVVLTGAGKQFCAGADLVAMRTYLLEELPVRNEPFNARALFPLTQRIFASRLVFIAAINGGATAGGLDLALACDLRVASSAAKLGETYINMGLAPGNGGSWLLPKLVGSGVAAELALTGEVVDAQRALALGLVSRVVEPDELLPTAVGLAARIADKPWRALEATKQALRASWTQDFPTAMNTSYQVTDALQRQPDLLEAVTAFLERRDPRFNVGLDGSPPPSAAP
jgi:enoyl-CoA hydratase